MSLCANIAAAPPLSILGVMVAACPPLALLLAAKLLNGALRRREPRPHRRPLGRLRPRQSLHTAPDAASVASTAEQRMWNQYQANAPRTHPDGRRVLQRCRTAGRIALPEH